MTTSKQRKHPCPDCKQCQQCSDTRCALCWGQGADAAEKRFAGLSTAEQIELFEAVNRGEAPEGVYGCQKDREGKPILLKPTERISPHAPFPHST